MTSKEMLQEIEEARNYYEVKFLIRNYFPIIKKDLEILEEIRNEYTVFKNGDDYFLRVGNNLYLITRKQYDKWVRWLKNEK